MTIIKKSDSFFKKIVKMLIVHDKEGRIVRKEKNEFDATSPGFLIVATLGYIMTVFFIIIGMPVQGRRTEPIPPEALPVAIPIFIVIYIVVVGGLYLYDKMKKRR